MKNEWDLNWTLFKSKANIFFIWKPSHIYIYLMAFIQQNKEWNFLGEKIYKRKILDKSKGKFN